MINQALYEANHRAHVTGRPHALYQHQRNWVCIRELGKTTMLRPMAVLWPDGCNGKLIDIKRR